MAVSTVVMVITDVPFFLFHITVRRIRDMTGRFALQQARDSDTLGACCSASDNAKGGLRRVGDSSLLSLGLDLGVWGKSLLDPS